MSAWSPSPQLVIRPGPPQAWEERPYTQMLRGPAHRWWRPFVGLAIVVAGTGVMVAGTIVAFGLGIALAGTDLDSVEESFDQWWVLLLTNLGLAWFVPVSMLAVWGGHLWRPRWTASVVGRLRWRWLAVSAAVSLVIVVASTAVVYVIEGAPAGTGTQVVPLLLVVFLTTPLQAAGEEYLFRGWLSLAIGSLFANARLGAVVAAAVSATAFALAHGSQDAWLFADRFAFGLLASYLVWRTGGLESAIAVHAVNNIVVLVPTVLTGGLDDALTATEAPADVVLLDVGIMIVLALVLSRLAPARRVLVPPRPLR